MTFIYVNLAHYIGGKANIGKRKTKGSPTTKHERRYSAELITGIAV